MLDPLPCQTPELLLQNLARSIKPGQVKVATGPNTWEWRDPVLFAIRLETAKPSPEETAQLLQWFFETWSDP